MFNLFNFNISFMIEHGKTSMLERQHQQHPQSPRTPVHQEFRWYLKIEVRNTYTNAVWIRLM